MDHKTHGFNFHQNLTKNYIHVRHPFHTRKDLIFFAWCLLPRFGQPNEQISFMKMTSDSSKVTCPVCQARMIEWEIYQGRPAPFTFYKDQEEKQNKALELTL